ncbi:MAG: hypothetical protein HN783_07305, partial [Ilumatobacter sp.]|nr:hypothetical protein [Ilumatobacter sp.]
HRAVDVELTKTGRRLWREMSVTYRRALQALFAIHLSAEDIADMQRILDQLVVAGQEFEETPATDDT